MRGAGLANVVWKLDLRAKNSIRPVVGSKSDGQYVFTSDFRKDLSNKSHIWGWRIRAKSKQSLRLRQAKIQYNAEKTNSILNEWSFKVFIQNFWLIVLLKLTLNFGTSSVLLLLFFYFLYSHQLPILTSMTQAIVEHTFGLFVWKMTETINHFCWELPINPQAISAFLPVTIENARRSKYHLVLFEEQKSTKKIFYVIILCLF